MTDINNLTDKIIEEAKFLADEIISDAKQKAEKIESDSNKNIQSKYDSIIEKGKEEAQYLKERLKSNALLKARDNELDKKQQVIDRLYSSTLEDLKNMDIDTYIEYIRKNATLSDKSTLIVEKDKLNIVREKFPGANISLERYADSGFIEIVDGIEINGTFSAQLDYIKDEVRGELAKVLFT
ncbi:V-type ATP synthase subunit E [Peptostreptococcus faecalis]|uniref:V-type ATP synthase subunit E n=1 Tax=Peptostreptococcus faecalis TaxID=2045015 RepID=UPI000C7BD9E0|nr:V-type ATP synthase subunit E [Peptostreptococcus faecalis]